MWVIIKCSKCHHQHDVVGTATAERVVPTTDKITAVEEIGLAHEEIVATKTKEGATFVFQQKNPAGRMANASTPLPIVTQPMLDTITPPRSKI